MVFRCWMMTLNSTWKRLLLWESHTKVLNAPALLQKKDLDFYVHIRINSFCCCCSWKDVIIIILPFRGGAKSVNRIRLWVQESSILFLILQFFSADHPACLCLPVRKHSALPRDLLVSVLQGVSRRTYVSSFEVLLAVSGSGEDSPHTRKHNRFLEGNDSSVSHPSLAVFLFNCNSIPQFYL